MRAHLTLLLALAGCGERYADRDLDGYGDETAPVDRNDPLAVEVAGDCNDSYGDVHPGASEVCDGLDDDCDGALDPAETDVDGDGFVSCAVTDWRGTLSVVGGLDCDDTRAEGHPGAAEACNGLDDDCDGAPGADELDHDADGFRVCDGDCDDDDAGVHPGAADTCDGVDTDCDGGIDAVEVDADGDGYVECPPTSDWRGEPGMQGGDCDDGRAETFPGAPETCNGVDDDCNAAPDPAEVDADLDGYVACAFDPATWRGALAVVGGADCLPGVADAWPSAPELCDGVDDDCDGDIPAEEADHDLDGSPPCVPQNPLVPGPDCDDNDPTLAPQLPERCDGLDNNCDLVPDPVETDQDGDGFVGCAFDVGGWFGDPLLLDGDCDDLSPGRHPGSGEICDGLDSDCDLVLPADEVDDDGDGTVECVVQVGFPWLGDPAVLRGGDCDDADAAVSPLAPELCDGLDQNCDGLPDPTEQDADGDGWIVCTIDVGGWMGAPINGSGDCYDGSALALPGGVEVCDRMDNDCNGLTDDDDPAVDPATFRTFYIDDDHDDFGTLVATTAACARPPGYAAGEGDCDDTARSIYPYATEDCNGIDDDCDDLVDDEDDSLFPYRAEPWFPDADSDGWGAGATLPQFSCLPPGPDFVNVAEDCDEGNPGHNPEVTEACDGVDGDCDGHIDLPGISGDPAVLGCDVCDSLSEFDETQVTLETLNHCVLEPNAVGLCTPGVDTNEIGERLHRVTWRNGLAPYRDELFLFFPPSTGNQTIAFIEWAAWAGYLTIQPGSENEAVIDDICPTTPDYEDCANGILEEQMYGVDVSPYADVGPYDGLEYRLEVLLATLEVEHPGMGWGSHLNPDGSMDWSKVVTGGWSKAAETAAYVADIHPIQGVLMISGARQYTPVNGPGTTLTPGCRMWALYHEQEWQEHFATPEEWEQGWRDLGLLGQTISLDTTPWPWAPGVSIFTTDTTDILYDECTAHKSVCYDKCLDQEAMFEPYMHMFCRFIEGPVLNGCAY